MYIKWFFILTLVLLLPNLAFAQQPKLVVPVAHTGLITTMEYSKNGRQILTASKDQIANLWDGSTGRLLASLNGHTGVVSTASFSPDGTKIVTASDDNTLKIWSTQTGKEILTLIGHRWNINGAEFRPICTRDSSGGNLVLSSSIDGTAKLWETNTGILLQTFSHIGNWVLKAQFSADGNSIIIAVSNDSIYEYKANTFELLNHFYCGLKNLHSFELSADSKNIACYDNEHTATILHVSSGNHICSLSNHKLAINAVQFSADGNTIVTASSDSTIHIWDINNGKELRILKGHNGWVNCIAFSPDGTEIASGSNDYTCRIWDAGNGLLLNQIDGFKSAITAIKFSPDGRSILTGTNNGPVRINEKYGASFKNLDGKVSALNWGEISPNGRKILLSTWDNTQIWDLQMGKPILELPKGSACFEAHFNPPFGNIPEGGSKVITCSDEAVIFDLLNLQNTVRFKGHKGFVKCANFDHQDKRAVSGSKDRTVRIWDCKTGEELLKIEGFLYTIESVAFSPNDSFIVTTSQENTAKVWNAYTGELVFDLVGHTQGVMHANFSVDGKKIVTASFDKTAKIWDAASGSLLVTLKGHSAGVKSAQFSPRTSDNPMGGKFAITGSDDNTIKLWDVETGELVKSNNSHADNIICAQFANNSSAIFSVSEDRTAQIWRINDSTTTSTMMRMAEQDYFNLIPTGHYQCSQMAAKSLHYVTQNLNVISFEQLDIQYNRPDLVIKSMGNNDTLVLKSFQNAYFKRINKLGIDTLSFNNNYNLPKAEIVNRDSIKYTLYQNKLELSIHAEDANVNLKSYNIWINDIPLYGSSGLHIEALNTSKLDLKTEIELSVGENRIEMSVTNLNGLESYKTPIVVYNKIQPKYKPKVYFIGIGMDAFENPEYNLKYSSKDIRDLAKLLKMQYGKSLISTLVFNKNFTPETLNKIKSMLLKTNVNDKVIVSYSGHGLLSKTYNYYLCSYSIDFANPEQKGISYELLEHLLDSIPARQKLMLLDACHSGEVDKYDIAQIKAQSNGTGMAPKGVNIQLTKPNTSLGLRNSFELMQELFVNVSKGTGATVISASGGMQFALENATLQNGVFTYSILEAMSNNKSMTVSQLKAQVGKRVVELTNGQQKPTSRNETINSDWRVW